MKTTSVIAAAVVAISLWGSSNVFAQSKPSYTPSKPSYTPSKPSYTPSKPSYTPSRPAYQAPIPQPLYKTTRNEDRIRDNKNAAATYNNRRNGY